MIKLGIVGTGTIAPHYINAVNWLEKQGDIKVRVQAAANRSEASNERARNELGIPHTYTNIAEMLSDEELDGIIVAVPILSTRDVTMNLIPYRIPLLIEKPPGLTLQQTIELSSLASRHQTSVMVAFNRRFYSIVDQAKQLIDTSGGLLGMRMDVFERYRALRENDYPLDKLEVLFTGNSIHCIDLIRHYCGDLKKIHFFSNNLVEEPFNHRYAALIVSESNTPITFQAYWHSFGNWNYELYIPDGKIQFSNLEEAHVYLRNREPYRLIPSRQDVEEKPGFVQQLEYFVKEVIIENKNTDYKGRMSIHDAVGTMRLVDLLKGIDESEK
ncbi:Gfo/Idh/MocA family oxidoreductase [Brevibacillus sp. AY1]|uniref:Gfo/Idh/MocA family protein n=1 Tax=Brevibacillus sp. AY1 TaxID=2807621 RepID=UPI002453C34B|nr:Gfo/Idh/MocA family oxidoreductase [Brevibacillus sp. AY1]MDH4618271.1 Gfo/Idh/MocA family oxidoreductase [Brevibacillus sp. AY1]